MSHQENTLTWPVQEGLREKSSQVSCWVSVHKCVIACGPGVWHDYYRGSLKLWAFFLSLTWLFVAFQHKCTHTNTIPTKRPPGCTHIQKSPSSVHIQKCNLLFCVSAYVYDRIRWDSVLREQGWAWLHHRWVLMNHIKLTLCLPDGSLFALLVSLLWKTEAMCCLELFTGNIWSVLFTLAA